MNRRIIQTAAVLAASTLALAACAGTPAGGTGGGGEDGDIIGGPGVDLATQTITVGALVPVSGVFAGAITNIEGMEAGFHRATSAGGVLDGWTVKVVNQDTKFDTATTIPLYESFKNDIAIISLALGATIMDALLPTVTDDNLLMIGAGPNPGEVREERIIPTFPLLSAHAAALIPYAIEEYDAGDSRFCTITVEEPFGEGFVTATDFAVDELGLERGIDVTLAPTADQLSPQVSALKEDGCDVVVGGGYGAFLQAFAVQASQLDYEPLFLTSNAAYSINVATGPGADWIRENVVMSVPGDEWEGTQAVGQANLREDLAAVNPDATPTANAHLTGYVNALYTSEVLALAIENGDLSREGIVQAVAEFEVWPDELGLVGGDIVFGASAQERVLPHKVSMFRIDPDVPTGLSLETYYYDSDIARDFMVDAE
ncbi:ABC transporter substrate-binding protein [Microbacterium sp. 18062]|uniref:ABC transporter substrate-binding protein n=1 Tax=Microbacterium sp. 18062 TaxID=2681410 RepID=UPI001359DA29|nr:ABC transporter substrate-binding protein [Microbacterium sp. 18062]